MGAMEIRPISPQAPEPAAQIHGQDLGLPRLAQSSFRVEQPVAAELLALTDPEAIALAAITGGVPASPATQAAPAGTAALATDLAALIDGVTAAAATPPAAAASAAIHAAPAPAVREALPAADDSAAAALAAAALSPAPASVAADGGAGALAALAQAGTAAQAAAATLADAVQAVVLAADAVAAAASVSAAPVATSAPSSTTQPGGLVPEDLGVVATANYLGGGHMGQAGTPAAGDPALQDDIPAVGAAPPEEALAANTYSNPHERNFGQAAAHHPEAMPAPAVPAAAPEVDLLS